MFQKSNHKGMAVILYPLLSFFDPENFKSLFNDCWYPYGLQEMKIFKQTCFEIANILA
jgi:hypothetical protein